MAPSAGRDDAADMHFSDHDIMQLDDDYLHGLPVDPLRSLSKKLLADLKEAHDRLNQSPSNSSRPPSTRAPWEKDDSGLDEKRTPDAGEVEADPIGLNTALTHEPGAPLSSGG